MHRFIYKYPIANNISPITYKPNIESETKRGDGQSVQIRRPIDTTHFQKIMSTNYFVSLPLRRKSPVRTYLNTSFQDSWRANINGGWTSYIREQSIGVKKWAEQLCPCPPPGPAPSSIRSVWKFSDTPGTAVYDEAAVRPFFSHTGIAICCFPRRSRLLVRLRRTNVRNLALVRPTRGLDR